MHIMYMRSTVSESPVHWSAYFKNACVLVAGISGMVEGKNLKTDSNPYF